MLAPFTDAGELDEDGVHFDAGLTDEAKLIIGVARAATTFVDLNRMKPC